MCILSITLLLVLLAHSCDGAVRNIPRPNLKERTNQIATIMLEELIRRATNGFTPTVAVSRNPMLPSTVFSPIGFFYLSSAVDADCSEPLLDFGVPVDACIWTESFSFKLQVPVAGTCEGAVVEYFLDEACTVYAGTTPVEAADTVCKNTGSPFATGLVHSQLHCNVGDETRNRQYDCSYNLKYFVCGDPRQYKYAYLRSIDVRHIERFHAPHTVPYSLEFYTQVTSCTEEECPKITTPESDGIREIPSSVPCSRST